MAKHIFQHTICGEVFTIHADVAFGRRASMDGPAEPTDIEIVGLIDCDGTPLDVEMVAEVWGMNPEGLFQDLEDAAYEVACQARVVAS